jgi:hypothetical protein
MYKYPYVSNTYGSAARGFRERSGEIAGTLCGVLFWPSCNKLYTSILAAMRRTQPAAPG